MGEKNYLPALLDGEKVKRLEDLQKSLERGFKNQIHFRSRYLMEVSVLNDTKFPTADAKYWQANLERGVHWQNLIELSFRYRDTEIDIKTLSVKIDRLWNSDDDLDKLKAEKLQIKKERCEASLKFMKKEAEERFREVSNWTEIMEKLEPNLEFSLEDANEHQAKSYPLRYDREVSIIKQVGASDMNGAINILSNFSSSLSNPKTREILKLKDQKKIEEGKQSQTEVRGSVDFPV